MTAQKATPEATAAGPAAGQGHLAPLASRDRAAAVAADLWPDAPAEIEPIPGGITNENFKATVAGETYVIRVFGERAEMLLIDRALECRITKLAAELGVGPELIAAQIDRGVLVTRYIPGGIVSADRMRDTEILRQVAKTLRKVHAVPDDLGSLDPFRDTRYYRDQVASYGVPVHPEYTAGIMLAAEIEDLVDYTPCGLCHSDLLSANFITAPDGIYLVDWEYAGKGDPLFDLANMSVNHAFTPEQDAMFLELYQGTADEVDLAKIRVMRFVSAIREAGWSYLQMAISTLPVDFGGYADACLANMRASSGERAFAEAMSLLRRHRSAVGYRTARRDRTTQREATT
jgi:thiamine kinase-like enzyme